MPAQSLSKLLPRFMLNLAGVDDRIKYKTRIEDNSIGKGVREKRSACAPANQSSQPFAARMIRCNSPLRNFLANFIAGRGPKLVCG